MTTTPAASPSTDWLRLDQQICFSLNAASRAFGGVYRVILKDLGLTYPQYLVMLVLWEHGELPVKKLGEHLRLDSGTLSPLLKRLETAGLVRRERSVRDERSVEVRLTEEGSRCASGRWRCLGASWGRRGSTSMRSGRCGNGLTSSRGRWIRRRWTRRRCRCRRRHRLDRLRGLRGHPADVEGELHASSYVLLSSRELPVHDVEFDPVGRVTGYPARGQQIRLRDDPDPVHPGEPRPQLPRPHLPPTQRPGPRPRLPQRQIPGPYERPRIRQRRHPPERRQEQHRVTGVQFTPGERGDGGEILGAVGG